MLRRVVWSIFALCGAAGAMGQPAAAPPGRPGTVPAPAATAPAPAPLDVTHGDPTATTIVFPIRSQPGATSRAIVVVPREYNAPQRPAAGNAPPPPQKRYPVVYLLHGYSGNYTNWYAKSREAGRPLSVLADRHNVIIVMPDGQFSSWYLNAAKDGTEEPEKWQWEDVIAHDLVREIDARFRTWAEPAGRGITGLSMGGHGALYLAARHPEIFGPAGSMSGVMDLTNSTRKYDLAKRLGPLETYRERWIENSVMTQIERFVGRNTGILIDCGSSDVFFGENRELHEKMVRLNIQHDYIERPGKHDWAYWINALPYHMQYLADRLRPAGVPRPTTIVPTFEPVVIDKGLPEDPYAVDIADMNGDGKPDIVLTRFFAVTWYENPSWKRHDIVTNATRQNVDSAVYDVDRDGKPDVAVAADWMFDDTQRNGSIWWARQSGTSPWPIAHLGGEPNIHRICWADVDGDGRKELVVAPLKGVATTPPDFMQRGVRLFLLRIPPDPKVVHWPQEMISNTLHVVHAVTPVQFDPDTAEELLVASFEGVTLFDRLPNGAWTQRRLCAGEQQTSPNRGSSEVCMGHLAGGTPFIATIEPFHGHEVAVYLPPPDPDALWIRTLLDDTLDAGHAIGAGDFDGDGNDEIVAGYRGRNRDGRKPTSLKLYQPIDPAQGAWKTHWIDTGDMACEDLKVADINGDGKPDIIAAGRSTRNLKVYLNRTVR